MQPVMQIQPNKWSCLPTAFANAADIPLSDLLDTIGHNGSAIVFPNLEEPYNRRSFHVIEVTSALLDMGIYCTPIIPDLTIMNRKDGKSYNINMDLKPYLEQYSGVLIGTFFTNPHAVSYSNGTIHDPKGFSYELDFSRMIVESFWIVKISKTSIKSKWC